MKDDDTIEASASDLKNAWHEYLERVASRRQEVVITRYGRRIARLTPYTPATEGGGIFGWLSGSVTTHGDLVGPTDEAWEADG